MTPTRDQLDAALGRPEAGFGVMTGDATDPDERALMLDWLMDLNARAVGVCFDPMEDGPGAHCREWHEGKHRCCWCGQARQTKPDPVHDTPSVAESDEQGAEGVSVPPEAQTATQRHSALDCDDGCSGGRQVDDWQGFVRYIDDGVMQRRHWDDVPPAMQRLLRRNAPWGPPAKGTHESDLRSGWGEWEERYSIAPGQSSRSSLMIYTAARDWSRSR